MWFHIRLLENCNLYCKHCYAQLRKRDVIMSLPMLRCIVNQISEIQADGESTVVYLSGGEPFLHPEFREVLDYVNKCQHIDRINILSNGTIIQDFMDILVNYKRKTGVQISIDGDMATHDFIRGDGTYQLSRNALYLLNKNLIPHWISYTVSKVNRHCFKSVLDLAYATGSHNNNITPYTGEKEQMLSYPEWKEFKYLMSTYAAAIGLSGANGENCCGFRYGCGAYRAGLTINPDGTATGCARFDRSEGRYDKLIELKHFTKKLMNDTCMKAAWGNENNFHLSVLLE